MAEVTETLLVKKLERSEWGSNKNTDNFAEEKELTVTITLAEYRDLVKNNAISDKKVEEANSDKWKRDDENNKLKAKVKELENTIFEYRKQFGELEKEEEE